MSRQTGYTVTIKAFVPAPKNDFAAQAAAATMVATLMKTGELTPDFLALVQVLNISGKYGSMDIIRPEIAEAMNEVLPGNDGSDPSPETDGEAPRKRKAA